LFIEPFKELGLILGDEFKELRVGAAELGQQRREEVRPGLEQGPYAPELGLLHDPLELGLRVGGPLLHPLDQVVHQVGRLLLRVCAPLLCCFGGGEREREGR
jgi:hypothetical protein